MADSRKRRRQRASRYRTTICKEGAYQLVIMVFLLVAAWLRQINLLLLIFAGLAVPLIWNWYFVVASLRNLTFRRHAPATCVAGDRIVIDIEATNERSRRNSWVVVTSDNIRLVNPDESRRLVASRPVTASAVFARIKPGETVRESYEGRLTQRGEYRLGPLTVSTRFPLGLVKRSFRIKMPQTLIVQPRQGRLKRRWQERTQRSLHGGVTVPQRLGIVEAEFHGLREYRSGDSKSWIHWRTTARRGEPIVRQFEQQRNLDMTVVLDLWLPPKPTIRDLELVEIAVSFAATLIQTQSKQGLGHLALATHQHEPKVTRGVASHALLREAQNHLATARCSREDYLPDVLRYALNQAASRQGEIVIIGTRPNELSDDARFGEITAASMKGGWRSRTVVVDCSSPKFDQLFQPPDDVAPAPPRSKNGQPTQTQTSKSGSTRKRSPGNSQKRPAASA